MTSSLGFPRASDLFLSTTPQYFNRGKEVKVESVSGSFVFWGVVCLHLFVYPSLFAFFPTETQHRPFMPLCFVLQRRILIDALGRFLLLNK